MAFNASGTDYGGFQRSRDRAQEGLTRAQDSAGRAAKQARIKKSGERSGLQKLVSAGVRGAAAYYTGGLSETMGGGAMIDSAMLGTDSEGGAVRNEYGDLVGAGSQIYSASKSMKAGKLGEQDAKFDKLMDRRGKNVKMLFDANMPDKAMEAQSAMEDMRLKYDTNRKDAEGKGWGGSGLGMSDEDMNIQPTAMSVEERAAKVAEKNAATNKANYAYEGSYTDMGDDQRRAGQTMMPAKADAPQGPQITPQQRPSYETQLSKPDVKSAALQSSTSSDQRTEVRKQEQDDLIKRITGGENRRQQSQTTTSNAAVSSPDNFSTYQDWAGNPGSKFVQGGATNRGVRRG